MIALPANFSLAHYRFTLEAIDVLHLPPYKGSALRGGFGHTFKRLVCVQPKACQQQCQLGNRCPYGYIFETAPPDEAEVLRNFSEVPRPFIIEPPTDKRLLLIPREQLHFALTLIGRGIDYLPYFIAIFRELGQEGLGRQRGQFRLQAVEAVSPYSSQAETIYRADDGLVRTINSTLGYQVIIAQAATLPTDRLMLNFLTPTRLKHEGRWVERGPSFQALIKALLGRVSALSYFHCGERLEADFRGLIDRAARVETIRAETQWEDWSRFSGRQQQRIEMGGLVGRVTYEGDLVDYLPLLALGELIHVGKGTVFGNGHYQIRRE